MCLLSICITTYNQSDLLNKNLDELAKYKGDDIEVVVSDNCSSEDIGSLVKSYNDDRFHHFRNSSNVGQDGNILFGLKHCKGEYVFLFRTRDMVISSNIPSILKCIREHPTASFFHFSALDENGDIRYKLFDKVYHQYKEAIDVHEYILAHPSGMLYRCKDLEIELVSQYIERYFDNHFSFISDQMIRMNLALKGDFVTSGVFGWKYAYSNRVKTVSGVVEGGHGDVHGPKYHNPRFSCEFDYAYNEFQKPYNIIYCKQLIRKFYKYEIVTYPMMLRDPGHILHYNVKKTSYDRHSVSNEFYNLVLFHINKTSRKDQKVLQFYLKKIRRSMPLKIIKSEIGYFVKKHDCIIWIYEFYKELKHNTIQER